MTTIVNTPAATTDRDSGMGFFLGVVLLLVVLAMFFIYGLPLIRQGLTPTNPQINVPDKVDININK